MAFPTIPTVGAGRVTAINQGDTTATRTFSAFSNLTIATGDLLIAVIVVYQTGTPPAFSGWTSGFTEFTDQGTSTTLSIGAAYKWTNGTESGSLAVTQAGTITGHASMILLAIPGAHASTPPEAGTIANGTAAAADPGVFDPANWAAEDTLWIAVSASGESSVTGTWTGVASAPANYGSYADTATADNSIVGQTELAVAFRQLNASSEDVGVFSVDVSNAKNSALLIAVRPAPPPVTKTQVVDALVLKTSATTQIIDSLVQTTVTKTQIVDALVKTTATKTQGVDAYVSGGALTKTQPVDARIVEVTAWSADASATTDAGAQTKTQAIDALVLKAATKNQPVDALVLITPTKIQVVDSLVLKGSTKQQPVDTLVRTTVTKTQGVDALVRTTSTKTQVVDAYVTLAGVVTKTQVVDAVISKAGNSKTQVVDALVLKTSAKTQALDALVRTTLTKTQIVSALILKTGTKAQAVDALGLKVSTKAQQVDAYVTLAGAVTQTRTQAVDAYVLGVAPLTGTVRRYSTSGTVRRRGDAGVVARESNAGTVKRTETIGGG